MVVRSNPPPSIISINIEHRHDESPIPTSNKAMLRPLEKQDIKSTSSRLPVADDNKCFAFRRCSLEHAKHNSARKLDATDTSNHCATRRSSMKTSSNTATDASRVKNVTFGLSVQVRPIPNTSDEEIQASWLSKEERRQIQLQCKADLKILKRIAKSPEVAKNDPAIQAVRSSISIRGLEQFSSKRLHRALWALQQDHIHAVLEAQHIQRDMRRCYGAAPDPHDIAKISAERSLEARKRALRQGLEDESVILGRKPSSSSSGHDQLHRLRASNRRGSMPAITIENEQEGNHSSNAISADNAPEFGLLEPFVYPRRKSF